MTKAPKLFHRDSFINRGDKAIWEIAQAEFEKWYATEPIGELLEMHHETIKACESKETLIALIKKDLRNQKKIEKLLFTKLVEDDDAN